MAETSRTRAVSADPSAVWEVLADFGAISSWAFNVDHSCLLDHPVGSAAVGVSRRVQVGRNTLVERITHFDPPHTLGYAIEGLPRLLRRVHACWELTPTGTATVVALTTTVEIGTNPVQRLAEGALSRLMARNSDVLLAGLAKRMESTDG